MQPLTHPTIRRPCRGRTATSWSQWIGSLVLHAIVLGMLSISIGPVRRGSPHAQDGPTFEASFLEAAGGAGDVPFVGTEHEPSGVVELTVATVPEEPPEPEPTDRADRHEQQRDATDDQQRDSVPQSAASTQVASVIPTPAAALPEEPPTLAKPRRVARVPAGFRGEGPKAGKGAQRGRRRAGGELAGATFFGVRGEGERFVYVIDSSSSMTRYGLALKTGGNCGYYDLEQAE